MFSLRAACLFVCQYSGDGIYHFHYGFTEWYGGTLSRSALRYYTLAIVMNLHFMMLEMLMMLPAYLGGGL